ncbi:sushi domain-containing protein 2 isoform X1 [Zootoca vivipara]|uniref:sushi domain-containing protein 2 isoform X1 n=1 Tax=Zootoca vivipara TaxID=8524 RepID=UPI00293BBBC1|nr:sushi domain-containing protein 2 isoform X1 [Zootoca vivipara]
MRAICSRRASFSLVFFCSLVLLGAVAQDSCSGYCGTPRSSCSCHATCESLGICCPDYWEFCLNASPYSGTLLGGKDFSLLNVTVSSSSHVNCRFAGSVETSGYVAGDGRVHCISPLLYQIGILKLEISSDGGRTFPWTATWVSVHHSKVSPLEKSTLVNETKWQYYGTPGTGGNLTVTWNHRTLQASHVNVEVWGYNETGKPYSSSWAAEWKYLYTLKRNLTNTGAWTFLPVPSAQYSAWEVGALRISSAAASDGQSNVAAIWSTEHALAWHLGGDFRKDPATWATAKCRQWDALEAGLPNFLEEIPDCPCTLAQARADVGRFHTDYGCDIEKGSVCTYHQGAVHCVRGVQASPRYSSGQQCCYSAAGTQVLTGDSVGGSTPDRGHDWGAPPYEKPPRVPGFSHWIYDVISFYYCCLWSNNCPTYLKRRPSSGCRKYRPPRVASAFGDPHFVTFDGTNFTFKGLGEYTVLESSLTSLSIQGRTHRAKLSNGTEAKVTGFSSVAMQENRSDVVEIRIPEHSDGLEVLLNQKALNFSEQTWMDLNGLFLSTAPGLNVTAMFSSGVGVEVRKAGRLLSLTALLPPKFLNHTQGLFGVMNGNPRDDLTLRNGTILDANTCSPEELFAFGADWAIKNETSLFTYDSQFLLQTFFYGPKHDPSFLPIFRAPEDPTDPLTQEVAQLCQSDLFCRFDALTTRDLAVGNSTRWSHRIYKHLEESLQPVVSCGWLAPPSHGEKNGTSYLAGSTVRFNCSPGFNLEGSAARTCQEDGLWSGSATKCQPNAGSRALPWGFTIGILGFLSLAAPHWII